MKIVIILYDLAHIQYAFKYGKELRVQFTNLKSDDNQQLSNSTVIFSLLVSSPCVGQLPLHECQSLVGAKACDFPAHTSPEI